MSSGLVWIHDSNEFDFFNKICAALALRGHELTFTALRLIWIESFLVPAILLLSKQLLHFLN